jgi:hypothetical protein
MHRHAQIPAARVVLQVIGQVVAADARVVAEQEVGNDLVGEPRIVDAVEVPQMMMGVDDPLGADGMVRSIRRLDGRTVRTGKALPLLCIRRGNAHSLLECALAGIEQVPPPRASAFRQMGEALQGQRPPFVNRHRWNAGHAFR